MDRQYSKAFFHSFIDSIQKLCRDYLEFDQAIELCGYLSLEIDNSKKERYVLSELIQNAGDVISESYCVKAFRTVRRGLASPQRKDENEDPRPSGISNNFQTNEGRVASREKSNRSSSGFPGFGTPGFCRIRDTVSQSTGHPDQSTGQPAQITDVKKPFNNPHGSRKLSGSVSKKVAQRSSPVELLRVPQRHLVEAPSSQNVSDAVPVRMFSSKSVNEGKLVQEVLWQQTIPSFNGSDDVSKSTSSRISKRKSASDNPGGGKKLKEQHDPGPGTATSSSATAFTQSHPPSSVSHPQGDPANDDVPIIIKEEGVPFMIVSPQDEVLESNGEGDAEVERLIEGGGGDNSNFLDGDNLGQLLDARLAEDMNKHTCRKTRGHVKLFQEYLISQGITRPVQDIPPTELDSILGTFFWDIRKDNGEEYEPSYLKNMQSSLERHLKHSGYSFCITKDKVFEGSRARLKEKQSTLFQQGKGNLPNKTVFLTDQDIDLLFRLQKLGDHSPDVLLNTMWLMVSLQFGMVVKNVRDHGDLLWKDIRLNVDGSGRESIFLKKCPYHSVELDESVPANRCFVRLYKKYQECRGRYIDDISPFYLCPVSTVSGEWYKPTCAGVNRLNNMVRRIVDGSGLPLEKKYTNSSIQMLIRGPLRACTT